MEQSKREHLDVWMVRTQTVHLAELEIVPGAANFKAFVPALIQLQRRQCSTP
jgi:hypothetical protein